MDKARTRLGLGAALSLGVLAWAAGLVQAQAPAGGRAQVMLSSGGLLAGGSSLSGAAGGQLYREIDDPHTGDRWLLVRNEQFPGGPGRLVRVVAHTGAAGQIAAGRAVAPPVIRPGDWVIVEEHTAVVDAVLKARALHPAVLGAVFDVRLAIGGRVVRVVALGPGRAALAPETGARP
jgi:hypothetical protein